MQLQAICFYRNDSRSRVIAKAMTEGIQSCGDYAIAIHAHKYERRPSGHVAVFYGYKAGGREIMQDYLREGKRVLFVDLGYWARRAGGRYVGYHRFSLDSRHPAHHVMKYACPDDRLNMLRKHPDLEPETNLQLKPWRKGQYIILAGMQKKSCDTYKLNYMEWETNALKTIQQHSKRPIIYRPKPKDDLARPLDGTIFSTRHQKLGALLKHAWCVVTHHSNVGVNAIVEGVPVFCDDGIVEPMAGGPLHNIESPFYPTDEQRLQWMQNVSYFQYSVPEMKAGIPWRNFKRMGLLP